jgi:hypothetical protein
MPSKSIDYSKTVIYKIVCNDLLITDIYVGSTTRFTLRKNRHKSACNSSAKASEFKVYKIIRDNGGWDNWSMIQIEEFPCVNGNEARARERYWYERLNPTLNAVRPKLTEEEIENYHTISYHRQLELHGTDYNKKRAQRRLELHPDYNQTCYRRRLELHPDYNKTKYLCECGAHIRADGKIKHNKSLKHQNYIIGSTNLIEA